MTCINDPIASSDHLALYIGPKSALGDVLARTFIYYENATWYTTIKLACGQKRTVTAGISYLTTAGLVTAFTDLEVAAAKCTDKRPCTARGVASAAADPVNTGSGDVSLSVPFFNLAQTPLALTFDLAYHSEPPRYPAQVVSPIARGWTHPYAQSLRSVDGTASSLYHLTAQGWDSEYTRETVNTWTAASPGDLRGTVTLVGSQYQLVDQNGTMTVFDAASGVWLSTADRWGNTIQGSYDGSGNLATITDSEGRVVHLAYAGAQLISVTLPAGEVWRLAYQNGELAQIYDPLHTGSTPWRSFTYAPDIQGVQRLLTGEFDEAGALLVGHTYDSQDRGITSVSQGGRDQVSILYDTPSSGQTQVLHAIDGVTNQLSVFTMHYGRGRYLADEVLGNCLTCGGATSDDQHFTYFNDNHVASRSDGNGHSTQWTYNAAGNPISMIEAAGTSQERTTSYQYDYSPWPNFQTEVDGPSAAKPGALRIAQSGWNAGGTPETTQTSSESGYLSASDASPTTYATTTTFDARHRQLATTGPRTDVSQIVTSVYYADDDADLNRRGRLQKLTDAAGLVTTFDNYDEFGTARTTIDPNGVVTQVVTDARGRVIASTIQAIPGAAGEATDYTTRSTFDGRDRLVSMTLPRGNSTAYAYEDGTNRRTDTIRLDSSGNQIEREHLTLNLLGDKVQEDDQVCMAPGPACGSWSTQRTESVLYDAHDRIAGTLHPLPAGSRTFNTYDPDGLLAAVQDEDHASPNTFYSYDALHRLTTVRRTLASAPNGVAITSYGYDVSNNRASVTDPNGNTTVYRYDDFNRLVEQDSPVTGATTYRYDAAGNMVSTTDARGAVTTRSYDAANRLLSSSSSVAGAQETVSYTYDSSSVGNFGKGLLATMTDPAGVTSYSYERRGLLEQENRTLLGAAYSTSYQYDANGNRSGITYPSGHQVNYSFDFADRPVSASSGSTVLVSGASYLPFGPEAQLVYGNGTTKTRAATTRPTRASRGLRRRPRRRSRSANRPRTPAAAHSSTPTAGPRRAATARRPRRSPPTSA